MGMFTVVSTKDCMTSTSAVCLYQPCLQCVCVGVGGGGGKEVGF